jgi:hypothetical protein
MKWQSFGGCGEPSARRQRLGLPVYTMRVNETALADGQSEDPAYEKMQPRANFMFKL